MPTVFSRSGIFLIALFLSFTPSLLWADCNSFETKDFSEEEKVLPFASPEISKEFSGKVSYLVVVSKDNNIISEFNKKEMRERIINYSKSKCIPKVPIYPDVRKVSEYYENGQIKYQKEFENGGKILTKVRYFYDTKGVRAIFSYNDIQMNGIVNYFHPDGSKNYSLRIINGMRSDCFQSQYPNNSIKATGCFQNDHLVGKYKHFHKNGKSEIAAFYNDKGELNGDYAEYFENGKVGISAFYKAGKREGKYSEYFESGNKKSDATYDSGAIISNSFAYYDDGALAEEYLIERKNRKGAHNKYYKSGKIKSLVNIENGKYGGRYVEYYEDGAIALKAKYISDKLTGPYLEYFKDGQIKKFAIYADGILKSNKTYFDHGGIETRGLYNENGELTAYMTFDNFGSQDMLYTVDGKNIAHGKIKYYRNGKIAAFFYYNHNGKLSSMEGYDPSGNRRVRANFAVDEKLSECWIFSVTEKLRAYYKETDGKVEQFEYYENGNVKLGSEINRDGFEIQRFYKPGQAYDLHYYQEILPNGDIEGILALLDNSTLTCSRNQNNGEVFCQSVANGELDILDAEFAVNSMIELKKDNNYTKINLVNYININNASSFYWEGTKMLVDDISLSEQNGQRCYELGYMSYCKSANVE